MALDPRNLIHLLAIAEHASFNRAAAACGLSQPALSSVREAQTVRSLLARAEEGVRAKRLGLEGPLRIGATFVDATLKITDAVRLVGGMRYTVDRKQPVGSLSTARPPPNSFDCTAGDAGTFARDFLLLVARVFMRSLFLFSGLEKATDFGGAVGFATVHAG